MSGLDQSTIGINPLDALLWTFRRNESDVVNLYDSLASLMKISTGGDMLNFGYWKDDTKTPLQAQTVLCKKIGEISELDTAHRVLDVGSGFSEPARIWKNDNPSLDISCVNVNKTQIVYALGVSKGKEHQQTEKGVNFVNSTATSLPFASGSMERILALESAQHFKPLGDFVSESRRLLRDKGLLVLAIPVVTEKIKAMELFKLGILSFTWSSEHYGLETLKYELEAADFTIVSINKIGSHVYEPLANYYEKNRENLRTKILKIYPSYVEKILFKSILKMREISQSGLIDYILLKSVAK